MTLTARLLLLVALAMVPALGIAAYNEYALRQSRESEVRAAVQRLTDQATADMRQVIDGIQRVAATMAQLPLVQEAASHATSLQACADFLVRLRREYPGELDVAVATLDGHMVCSSRGSINLGSVRGSHLRRAIETGSLAVGTYAGAPSGTKYLSFAYPVRDDQGRTVGAILPALGLNWLTEYMRSRFAGLNATLVIADRDLTYLLRLPRDDAGQVGKPAPPESQRLARMAGKGAFEIPGAGNGRWIAAIEPLTMMPTGSQPDLLLAVALSHDTAFIPFDAATRRTVALFVLSFILALLAAVLGGRYFVRAPVAHLLAAAARWRKGEYEQRVEITGGGEFRQLGDAFNAMADEISTREQHRNLLINELNHRVKNTLATVQSLAANSLRTGDPAAARAAFEGRLFALSTTHNVLTRENWGGAGLHEVVNEVTRPHRQEGADRFEIGGPALQLPPGTALPLSMALHELCTNAVKYGALSNRAGTIAITWETARSPTGATLRLRWRESGGPAVAEPPSKGFGTRLLERGVASELGGRVEIAYEASGLTCMIEAPLPAPTDGTSPTLDAA